MCVCVCVCMYVCIYVVIFEISLQQIRHRPKDNEQLTLQSKHEVALAS